jgi:hypothetical protein
MIVAVALPVLSTGSECCNEFCCYRCCYEREETTDSSSLSAVVVPAKQVTRLTKKTETPLGVIYEYKVRIADTRIRPGTYIWEFTALKPPEVNFPGGTVTSFGNFVQSGWGEISGEIWSKHKSDPHLIEVVYQVSLWPAKIHDISGSRVELRPQSTHFDGRYRYNFGLTPNVVVAPEQNYRWAARVSGYDYYGNSTCEVDGRARSNHAGVLHLMGYAHTTGYQPGEWHYGPFQPPIYSSQVKLVLAPII